MLVLRKSCNRENNSAGFTQRSTSRPPYPPTLISLGSNLGGMMATLTSDQRPAQMAADSQREKPDPRRKPKGLGRAILRRTAAKVSRDRAKRPPGPRLLCDATSTRSRETCGSPPPWLLRAAPPGEAAKPFEAPIFLAGAGGVEPGARPRRLPGTTRTEGAGKRKTKWAGGVV